MTRWIAILLLGVAPLCFAKGPSKNHPDPDGTGNHVGVGSLPSGTKPLSPSPQWDPLLEIKDWLAMGSGCQGRKGWEGKNTSNVSFHVSRDAQDPLTYWITFDASEYGLRGDQPINPQRPTFARECAFRVSAFPQKRWKIASIAMESQFVVEKDKGARAQVFNRLLTGSSSLNEQHQEFATGDQMRHQAVTLKISPNPEGAAHFSQVPCEEPKVLGGDLSLVNHRDSFQDMVNITQPAHSKVRFAIKMAPCMVTSH